MSGLKRKYLCRQYHTDSVAGLQKPLVEGALRALECCLALVAGVSRRKESVCDMFKHLGLEAFGETLCRRVEIAEHCGAPQPTHQADDVRVHPRHEENHSPT